MKLLGLIVIIVACLSTPLTIAKTQNDNVIKPLVCAVEREDPYGAYLWSKEHLRKIEATAATKPIEALDLEQEFVSALARRWPGGIAEAYKDKEYCKGVPERP